MLTYCLKYRKNTEILNWKILKTKNGNTMFVPKCAVCANNKSRFMKEQEAKGSLRSLWLKTLLNKFPLLGDILFL